MFHDEATITIRSGNGGPGCVSFRREKYIPEGGPDGGDGGRGGSVIAVANRHINTLTAYIRRRKWKAKNGLPGEGRNKSGRSGVDLILEMPCGTIIRHQETGELLADLTTDEQEVILAAGGDGGKGNVNFKSSVNQTPRKSTPGGEGIPLPLALELKLIADVGLIGFPNAGKSTLISRLSAARPKVANYPFTTLRPHLGVMERDDCSVVIADIPGLIEGAAEGIGLGHQFLRHVERCRLLLHVLDGTDGDVDELCQRHAILNAELARFSDKLKGRKQLLVINKSDSRPDMDELATAVAKRLDCEVLRISAVTGDGLDVIRNRLLEFVNNTDL